jgi:hypothetical protein
MLRNELLQKPYGYLFEYAEIALDVLEISNRSLLNVFDIRCQKASFVYRYIWQHSKPILVFVRAFVSFVGYTILLTLCFESMLFFKDI